MAIEQVTFTCDGCNIATEQTPRGYEGRHEPGCKRVEEVVRRLDETESPLLRHLAAKEMDEALARVRRHVAEEFASAGSPGTAPPRARFLCDGCRMSSQDVSGRVTEAPAPRPTSAGIELADFIDHLKARKVRTFKGEFVASDGTRLQLQELTFERDEAPAKRGGKERDE